MQRPRKIFEILTILNAQKRHFSNYHGGVKKRLKNHTPCRGFKLIKNTSNLLKGNSGKQRGNSRKQKDTSGQEKGYSGNKRVLLGRRRVH